MSRGWQVSLSPKGRDPEYRGAALSLKESVAANDQSTFSNPQAEIPAQVTAKRDVSADLDTFISQSCDSVRYASSTVTNNN